MKKKILSLLLALVMAVSSASMIAAEGSNEEVVTAAAETDRILGDINDDGAVDISDAVQLFMYSMLPEQYGIDYPGTLDFDKNGSVDIGDAVRLFMYSMIPEEYPIEWGEIVDTNPNAINELTINGADISEYVIACNAAAGGVISNAAGQLQKYIALATGVTLPIEAEGVPAGTKRILIDETVVTDPNNFKYYSDEDGIVLAGSAKRSALYAVFHFLENQLGWRFFAADTEVCYESNKIALADLDVNFEHVFAIRDVYWTEAFNEEFSIKRYQNGDGKRRLMYNNNPSSIELGGSESFHPYGIHTFAALAEQDEVNQPCLNDENVYQTMLKNAKAWLAADPSRKAIHVSQNDNRRYCTCTKCSADINTYGSPAGSIIKLVNRMDEDLKAAGFNDITIITFAYDYSFPCPKGITCNDDIAIELCTINYCYNHPFNDPDCAINAANMKEIEAWAKICDEFYIWDYSINFKYLLSPFPNFDVLREDMQVLSTIGAKGILSQGNYQTPSAEFGALRSYLLCRLMENPYMSAEEYDTHMNEFLAAYYGPGWKNIRSYIDYFTALSNTKNSCFTIYSSPEEMFGNHAFAPESEQLKQWFQDAIDMAETDLQKAHIRQSQICCEYLRIGAIHKDITQNGKMSEKRALQLEVKALYNACKEFGISRIAENCELPYEGNIDFTKNPRAWWNLHEYRE